MKIQCLILRKGGTRVVFGPNYRKPDAVYRFKGPVEGPHVADVDDPEHADTLLAIVPAAYLEFEDEDEDDSADDGARKSLRAEYRSAFGKAPGPRWTNEEIASKLASKVSADAEADAEKARANPAGF